ncbi:MAG: hypothetical protein HY720_28800 [Planctomycetes bacterium]|nr:hypothetical protein [Planctomycetota bacterium]
MPKPKIDVLFLKIALRNGAITEEACENLVRKQSELALAGQRVPMARICLDEKVLDENQVAKILRAERYMEVRGADKHLAQVLEIMQVVDPDRIAECLAEQKRIYRETKTGDFPRLADIVVLRGHATPKQIEEAVKLQEETRLPSQRLSPSRAIERLKEGQKPPDSTQSLTDVLAEFGIDRAEAEAKYKQEIEIYVQCEYCGRSNLRSASKCKRCGNLLSDPPSVGG